MGHRRFMSNCFGRDGSSHYDERGNPTRQGEPLFRPNYPTTSVPTEPIHVDGAVIAGEHQELIKKVSSKVRDNVQPQHRRAGPPSIFRVAKHMRENSAADKAYRPLIVPIGPYHQDPFSKQKKKKKDPSRDLEYDAIQKYKWQCVRAILSRHSDEGRAGELMKTCLWWLVQPNVQTAVKEYYSEEISFSKDELAQILFADACFIIHLLLRQQETNRKKKGKDGEAARPVEKEKTTLVEKSKATLITGKDNGKIVEIQHEKTTVIETSKAPVLIGSDNGDIVEVEHEKKTFVETNTARFMDRPPPKTQKEEKKTETEMVVLDIMEDDKNIQGPLIEGQWTWNLVLYDLLKLENQIPFFVIQTLYDKLKIDSDTEELLNLVLDLFSHIRPKKAKNFQIFDHKMTKLYHLLHLFHSSLVYEIKSRQPNMQREKAPERIPNATELRRALIKINKKKNEDEASSFLDVTYENGIIELPKLQVYDYTDSLFRNLIAFEQYFSGFLPQNAYITLYSVLMDCIIDTPQDARLLVSDGILVSRLSSNEAASDLFNKICRDIHYNVQGSYLEDLFVNVNNDYESKMRQSLATLRRNYCPNRWAICSVMAAILLLILTILQVIFAIFQYYIPRN